MEDTMPLQKIQTKNKEKTLVAETGLSLDVTVRFYCSWCWKRFQLGCLIPQKGGV